jgi:hypothetical protein
MIIYGHNRSKKKKPTKKQLQEQQDFLESVNKIALPSGSKTVAKKAFRKLTAPKRFIRETEHIPSKPDTHLGALPPTGIMRDFHKLSLEDREIVNAVGECIAPMHKGNLVYVTPGINPAGLGRKNEVL